MTIVTLMDDLAEFLRPVVADYSTKQASGKREIQVFAGYAPIRRSAEELPSFIYTLVTSAQDNDDGSFSTATVEIGFSIYDNSEHEPWRSLFNLLEHIRQHLLQHRLVADQYRLVLPLKINIPDEQPYPQWQGSITATYTIGQPTEEVFDFEYEDEKITV